MILEFEQKDAACDNLTAPVFQYRRVFFTFDIIPRILYNNGKYYSTFRKMGHRHMANLRERRR